MIDTTINLLVNRTECTNLSGTTLTLRLAVKSDNSSPAILFRDSEKLDATIKLSLTLPTITLTTPNVDKILGEVTDNRDEIHQALTQGTFARVLRMNSPMLFRSVLPILQLPFHRVDGFQEGEHEGIKRRRLGARLTAIGSFKDMMDHAPRFYVNQNSIGRLTTRMRSNLLQQAFVYHLNLSVDSLGQCNIEAVDKNKLSELKLIKTMQQDLRRRFQAIEGNKDSRPCSKICDDASRR